jgi:hypothetical protein
VEGPPWAYQRIQTRGVMRAGLRFLSPTPMNAALAARHRVRAFSRSGSCSPIRPISRRRRKFSLYQARQDLIW